MFFKKRSAEDELAELAPYVNKKVKDMVDSPSYKEKLEVEVGASKVVDVSKLLGSFPDAYYLPFKKEIDSILKHKKSNRILLISCINSYMAYFEQHGGMPKSVKAMTPSQVFLGLYHACVSLDSSFYE